LRGGRGMADTLTPASLTLGTPSPHPRRGGIAIAHAYSFHQGGWRCDSSTPVPGGDFVAAAPSRDFNPGPIHSHPTSPSPHRRTSRRRSRLQPGVSTPRLTHEGGGPTPVRPSPRLTTHRPGGTHYQEEGVRCKSLLFSSRLSLSSSVSLRLLFVPSLPRSLHLCVSAATPYPTHDQRYLANQPTIRRTRSRRWSG